MIEKLRDSRIKGIYNFSPYIYYSNEQLLKDCCLIPYMFHKYLGYRTVIVTAQKEEYTYLELLQGLEMDIIETPINIEEWVNICCDYITEHYQKIDVLFCFGAYETHIKMVQQYKRLRPDGKVILKLDANIYWADRISFNEAGFQAFLGSCNVITVESKRLKKYLSQKWPYKIEYIPNGSDNTNQNQRTEYFEKDNVILTVGRLGTRQKATEILLEAFQRVADSFPRWQLRLVGSIDETFKPYMDNFFCVYPHLRDRVIFTGKILDKNELELEYKKAKIFALTSIMEGGTPNVWVEAARNGCYIVCSDIDAVEEATNWGACGRSFEINDVEQLSSIFLEICNDESYFARGCYDIQEYQKKFFDYRKMVYKLEHLLNIPSGEQ